MRGARGTGVSYFIPTSAPSASVGDLPADLAVAHPDGAHAHGVDDLRVVHRFVPDARRGSPPAALRRALERRLAAGVAVSDAVCVSIALWVIPLLASPGFAPRRTSFVVAPAILGAWLAAFGLLGLYSGRRQTVAEEMRRVLAAVGVGLPLAALIARVSQPISTLAAFDAVFIAALTLEAGSRLMWRAVRIRVLRRSESTLRTLVIGTGDQSARLLGALRKEGSEFQPIGYVASTGYPAVPDGLPIVATIDHLEQAIREHGIDCLFVTSTGVPAEDLETVASVARRTGAEVRVQTPLVDIFPGRVSVEPVGSGLALALRSATLTRGRAGAKRALDLVLSSAALLLSIPIWVIALIAIGATSRGGILFHQRRVTMNGRVFTLLKFRSMVQDAGELAAANGMDPTVPFFKPLKDSRVTRVGSILRRSSIDEIPQLLNVIRGDMSLVGPRPLPVEQVEANSMLTPRHEVRAGLTGWWQVNERSDLDAEESVRLDQIYIENWSLGLDLAIMMRTVACIVRGRGTR